MSSTVRFTPLHPQDHDDIIYTSRNAHGAGVRITDLDGLKDELNDSLVSQMDTRKAVDRDDYPASEWEVLLGFTTWGGDEDDPLGGADYHNVSNTGAKDMARHWADISNYTEPFFLYQTGYEGGWPHAATLDDRDGSLYYVEAADGEATLEELTVSVVDRDPVDF